MLGLALGGGAYRGVAHLGVLKAFEEEGLKPGFLSGTSSGGLAAAFYAFGMPLEEIRDLADKLHLLLKRELLLSECRPSSKHFLRCTNGLNCFSISPFIPWKGLL